MHARHPAEWLLALVKPKVVPPPGRIQVLCDRPKRLLRFVAFHARPWPFRATTSAWSLDIHAVLDVLPMSILREHVAQRQALREAAKRRAQGGA